MTVKELIKLLRKENPNDIVIVSRDSEGNGYSPLDELSQGMYKKISSWSESGEVRI
jgi:hypothetical protein